MAGPHTVAGVAPPDKASLRRQLRACLQATDQVALKQADECICQRLALVPEFLLARTVLAFAPLPGEIDIWPLLTKLAAGGQRLCLPRISGPGVMEAREAHDLRQLRRNSYGIAEPAPNAPLVLPGNIDIVLTPGLAFDTDLWRLGRGGGYYDRFLAGCAAYRLGLAREWQIVEYVPHEPLDIPMQAVLSEQRYLTATASL